MIVLAARLTLLAAAIAFSSSVSMSVRAEEGEKNLSTLAAALKGTKVNLGPEAVVVRGVAVSESASRIAFASSTSPPRPTK